MENLEYTGQCKFVGQNAFVKMNGCKYDFNIVSGIGFMAISGCNAGKTIEFGISETPVCNVSMGEQSGLGEVIYHSASSTEVTAELHVAHIAYTATGTSCPETGFKTNGNYTTGNFILIAEADNANREMEPVLVG